MTTPNPITVSVATDKTSYVPGDTVSVTVTYTDSSTVTEQLTVTATVSDNQGNTASGTAQVSVVTAQEAAGSVQVTDSFGDVYSAGPASPGTAVFTALVGTGPAASA